MSDCFKIVNRNQGGEERQNHKPSHMPEKAIRDIASKKLE